MSAWLSLSLASPVNHDLPSGCCEGTPGLALLATSNLPESIKGWSQAVSPVCNVGVKTRLDVQVSLHQQYIYQLWHFVNLWAISNTCNFCRILSKYILPTHYGVTLFAGFKFYSLFFPPPLVTEFLSGCVIIANKDLVFKIFLSDSTPSLLELLIAAKNFWN